MDDLSLGNVRPFDRPMTAGPNDRFVGRDDMGNKVYETVAGKRYSIRPATEEESQTTRAKVEGWVDEGAPLPSWEQITETMKAMPGAVYDSAQRSLSGDASLGELMGFAGASGAPGVASRVGTAFDPSVVSATGVGPKASEILSFADAKKKKELTEYYKNFRADLQGRMSVLQDVTEKAREIGLFEGFERGDRFLSKVGPLEITGIFMRKVDPNSKGIQRAFERFGIKPEFVEVDGESYLPMARTRQGDPNREGDWQEGDVYLDLFRASNYPKMGGLQSVKASQNTAPQTNFDPSDYRDVFETIEDVGQQHRNRFKNVLGAKIVDYDVLIQDPAAIRAIAQKQLQDLQKDENTPVLSGRTVEGAALSRKITEFGVAAGRIVRDWEEDIEFQNFLGDAAELGSFEAALEKVVTTKKENPPKFAEGGVVENQTPVPPGATPKEVADDVPIMASEGEYVLPANVVRFIGLDKIEKMVEQAKTKLAELDQKGRIGGDTGEDEELPFNPEELQRVPAEDSAAGIVPQMAEGGMVSDPNMQIDLATGLPLWLLQMQNAPQASAPAPTVTAPPVASPIAPAEPPTRQESSRDRDFQVNLTGTAQSVAKWSPAEFNKYARTRGNTGQALGSAAASMMVPFGGLATRMRGNYLERAVPRGFDTMLETGRDLQGNPLTAEQITELRTSYDRVKSTPKPRTGAIGALRGLAEDTGLIRRREPTAEREPRRLRDVFSGGSSSSPKASGDGLVSRPDKSKQSGGQKTSTNSTNGKTSSKKK